MPEEVVLLTGEVEGPHFRTMLESCNPHLVIVHAQTLEQLETAFLRPPGGGGPRRLVAFSTSVIVPKTILGTLQVPAYNFHPGPPTYPGSHAASFAIYDGAEHFGATVHVMEEKVDCGPIVALGLCKHSDGPAFLFIFQSKKPPFDIRIIQIPDHMIERGRIENAKAMDVFARGIETDEWPGYEQKPTLLETPQWMEDKFDRMAGDGAFELTYRMQRQFYRPDEEIK